MDSQVFINNNGTYREVVIDGNTYEVNVLSDTIDITIPENYICIYHKLLAYFADFGIDLLSIDNICKTNKSIIDCWYLFQSAVACNYLGKTKQADLYIDYIDKQLAINYKGTNKKVYDGGIYFPIDNSGELEVLNTCNTNVNIGIDLDSGIMYASDTTDNFTIEDNDLIVQI